MATQDDLNIDKKRLDIAKETLAIKKETERIDKGLSSRSSLVNKIEDAILASQKKEIHFGILKEKHEKAVKKAEVRKAKFHKKENKDFKKEFKYEKDAKLNLEKTSKVFDSIIERQNKLLKIQQSYGKEFSYVIRGEKDMQEALEHRLRTQEALADSMVEQNMLDKEAAELYKKRLRGEESIAGERQNLLKMTTERFSKVARFREEAKEFAEKAATPEQKKRFVKEKKMELGKEGTAGIRQLMGSMSFKRFDVKGIFEAAKGLGETSKKSKILAEEMRSVGGGAKGAAGMLTVLGDSLSFLGKIGWIGLIVNAVIAVAKGVNELDKFIKEYNMAFRKMYGPTVAIKNVKESISKFTDAVFDMNRNLKYGIDSKEVLGLFEAMSAGGMSLKGVGDRISGGYGRAIEEAAKLSINFGTSLEDMGGMIADQMIDLRASLSDVSKTFEKMSSDADIAGISSKKFYEATYAAASSLSFYGNFLDDASARLRDFVKTGKMGFKDAAKHVETLETAIKNMSWEERMATIGRIGGTVAVGKMYETLAKKGEAEEKKIRADIKAMEEAGAPAEDISAKKRELDMKRQNTAVAKQLSKSSAVGMATGMDMLADRGGDIMMDLVHSVSGLNIWDLDQLQIAIKTLPQQFQEPVKEIGFMFAGQFDKAKENFATSFKKSFETMEKAGVGDQVRSIVQRYRDKGAKGETIDLKAFQDEISGFKESLGMSVNDFTDFFQENADILLEGIKGGEMNEKKVQEAIEARYRHPIQMKATGTATDANKRLKDLTEGTTSISKYMNISAEALKYMAASKMEDVIGAAAVSTAKTVGSFFATFVRWIKGGKDTETEDEFREKKLGTLVKIEKRRLFLEKKKKELGEGSLFIDDINKELADNADEAKKLGKGFEYLSGEISAQAEQSMSDTDKTMAELQNSVEDLTKENDDLSKSLSDGTKWNDKEIERRKALIETNEKEMEEKKKQILQLLAGPETSRSIKVTQELAQTGIDWFDNFNKKLKGMPDATIRVPVTPAPVGIIPAATKEPMGPPASLKKPAAQTEPLNVPASQDFRALTEGFTKISKNDLVIDSDSLAKGISAGAGQIIPGMNAGGMSAARPIEINLNIGSVNGDVDDLIKRIGPAIEQTFRRLSFSEQKRK